MYAARVEHLTQHETVTALCEVCGHVAEVPVETLWRKLPGYTRGICGFAALAVASGAAWS